MNYRNQFPHHNQFYQMKPIDNQNQNQDFPLENDINIAKLSVLGGIITTIGGIISTYARILALEQLQSSQNPFTLYDQKIDELEKQIQYLTKELHRQKYR